MAVPAAAAAVSVCAYGILIHVKRRERVREREREKEKRIIISTLQYRNHLRGPFTCMFLQDRLYEDLT